MLTIVNALVRSLLEYACPLFTNVCPSSLNSLEVIYNAALRVATGLPKCTPIPLLRREANVSSVGSRLRCLTHRFLIRQVSLPNPPFSVSSSSSGSISAGLEELLSLYNVDPNSILKFSWPSYLHLDPGYQIIVDGLPFHIPSLPANAVLQAWYSWRSSLPSGIILSSDASKDDSKTAIAAYNETTSSYVAMLIPHLNSIFTAEALALHTALSSFVSTSNHYFLLTDSLSVLRALQNCSVRSPRVILLIHNLLCQLKSSVSPTISLVWCPGHKSIPPNEAADSYARNGPYRTRTLNWVAPEDLMSRIRQDWNVEKAYSWMNSDYYATYPHLSDDYSFRRWTNSRQEDVWISRWRTRMWLTNNRLHKMKLTQSPLCSLCCVNETPDHVLLHCTKYASPRSLLLSALNLPSSASYSDVLSACLRSRKGISALIDFSSTVARN